MIVKISEELRRVLESVPNSNANRGFHATDEQKAAILEFYPKKNKEALAKTMHLNRGLLTRIYRAELAKSEEGLDKK